MANQWLRLWHDMPTDPKWRTIAKVSGQRIGDVMAVYMHLLVCASNATERGRTQSFNCEDVATALDMDTEQVQRIVDTMQGRVLDGDMVAGWEKRQVAREDGSAERAKQWREEQKAKNERTPNAGERNRAPDKDTDKDKEKNNTPKAPKGADVLFDQFWAAYPKKDGKIAARKAFAKLNPDAVLVGQMVQALEWQKRREQWTKDGGQYIPDPATWLNKGRWEDARPGDISVSRPTGPDPELEKIKAHKGAPIPPEIAARLAALKGTTLQ